MNNKTDLLSPEQPKEWQPTARYYALLLRAILNAALPSKPIHERP